MDQICDHGAAPDIAVVPREIVDVSAMFSENPPSMTSEDIRAAISPKGLSMVELLSKFELSNMSIGTFSKLIKKVAIIDPATGKVTLKIVEIEEGEVWKGHGMGKGHGTTKYAAGVGKIDQGGAMTGKLVKANKKSGREIAAVKPGGGYPTRGGNIDGKWGGKGLGKANRPNTTKRDAKSSKPELPAWMTNDMVDKIKRGEEADD